MGHSFDPADRILISNAVFTGKEDAPRRAAVAVADDRIAWVGDPDAMPAELRGPDTAVEDFGDDLIMAGFHDAHMHVFHSALP